MSSDVGEAQIRVVIVDDHTMVAESIGAVLQGERDIDVIGIAGTVADGVAMVGELQPDVVVMDFQLPDGDGGDATKLILDRWPTIAVIMLTGTGASDALAKAIEAGCTGFLMKGLEVRTLDDAVRAVANGEVVIHTGLLHEALPTLRRHKKPDFDITPREREILEQLSIGASTDKIAATLFLSRNTVRNHISNVTAKLGAHSRLEAVAIALREGVIAIA